MFPVSRIPEQLLRLKDEQWGVEDPEGEENDENVIGRLEIGEMERNTSENKMVII